MCFGHVWFEMSLRSSHGSVEKSESRTLGKGPGRRYKYQHGQCFESWMRMDETMEGMQVG